MDMVELGYLVYVNSDTVSENTQTERPMPHFKDFDNANDFSLALAKYIAAIEGLKN